MSSKYVKRVLQMFVHMCDVGEQHAFTNSLSLSLETIESRREEEMVRKRKKKNKYKYFQLISTFWSTRLTFEYSMMKKKYEKKEYKFIRKFQENKKWKKRSRQKHSSATFNIINCANCLKLARALGHFGYMLNECLWLLFLSSGSSEFILCSLTWTRHHLPKKWTSICLKNWYPVTYSVQLIVVVALNGSRCSVQNKTHANVYACDKEETSRMANVQYGNSFSFSLSDFVNFRTRIYFAIDNSIVCIAHYTHTQTPSRTIFGVFHPGIEATAETTLKGAKQPTNNLLSSIQF